MTPLTRIALRASSPLLLLDLAILAAVTAVLVAIAARMDVRMGY